MCSMDLMVVQVVGVRGRGDGEVCGCFKLSFLMVVTMSSDVGSSSVRQFDGFDGGAGVRSQGRKARSPSWTVRHDIKCSGDGSDGNHPESA